MVCINMQVADSPDIEINKAVLGKKCEHVVEKTNARIDV